jgi:hypothetical protein
VVFFIAVKAELLTVSLITYLSLISPTNNQFIRKLSDVKYSLGCSNEAIGGNSPCVVVVSHAVKMCFLFRDVWLGTLGWDTYIARLAGYGPLSDEGDPWEDGSSMNNRRLGKDEHVCRIAHGG